MITNVNSSGPVEPVERAPWRGRLELAFERRRDRGEQPGSVVVTHQHAVAPLKFQRPFYPEGPDLCHGALLHTAGGVVGGDRLDVDIHLGPQTNALLTTVAATKLYRSTGAIARQHTHLTIGEGACLEWFPQDAIAFRGCNFEQTARIDLAAGARWCGWELLRFGRTARGEQFTAGRWRSRLEVWQGGQPLWVDLQTLEGSDATWHSPNHLKGCPIVATFALLGAPCDRDAIPHLRQETIPQNPSPQAEFGLTRLPTGLLGRYRGHSSLEARQWLQTLWRSLRPHYLHRPAAPVRLWG